MRPLASHKIWRFRKLKKWTFRVVNVQFAIRSVQVNQKRREKLIRITGDTPLISTQLSRIKIGSPKTDEKSV